MKGFGLLSMLYRWRLVGLAVRPSKWKRVPVAGESTNQHITIDLITAHAG